MPTERIPLAWVGLVTTAEAARLADVDRTTIQTWIKRGHLEPVRDLAAYLSSHPDADWIRPEQLASPGRGGNVFARSDVMRAKRARGPVDRWPAGDAVDDLREAVQAVERARDRLLALGMSDVQIQARIRAAQLDHREPASSV